MSYESANGRLRLWVAGDLMPTRRLVPFREPSYQALIDLIKAHDVAFGNLETVVRRSDEGYPNFTQGTPMSTPPQLLEDLQWMGFNLFSIANNHATDYGTSGVLAMCAHLDHAGCVAAGAGPNLASARAPRYLDTRAGRVALVACTSFFRMWNRAADQRPDVQGRPGINPLAFERIYRLPAHELQALADISDALGMTQEHRRMSRQFYSHKEVGSATLTSLPFLGAKFELGERAEVVTRVNKDDAVEVLRQIDEARRQADWVIFSFHCHEFGSGNWMHAQNDAELTEPAQFYREFSRAAIEHGADVVVGHGHHVTLGLEMYQGRPIFHGLGNFIFQNDTVDSVPAESYRRFGLGFDATPADFMDARTGNDTRGFPVTREFWEGIAATCEFSQRQVARLVIHPVDLGFGTSRAQRGRPLLASGEAAQRILERIRTFSAPYGINIRIENGTGIVEF